MPPRRLLTSLDPSEAPALVSIEADNAPDPQKVVLGHAITVVGSKAGCDVLLPSDRISSRHAVIIVDRGQVWARDLSSRTGTFVNTTRIIELRLQHEDVLTIGPHSFRVSLPTMSCSAPIEEPCAVSFELPGELRRFDGRLRVISFGRRPGCNVFLSGHRISTTHAILCRLNQGWFVRDTFSRSGTFLNEARVREAQILPGDLLSIASMQIRVVADPLGTDGWAATAFAQPAELPRPTVEPPISQAAAITDPAITRLLVPSDASSVERIATDADDISPDRLESLFGPEQPREGIHPAVTDGNATDPPNDEPANSVELGPLAAIIPDLKFTG